MDIFEKNVNSLKQDIVELRSETKYIMKILDKISETLEENKKISAHLIQIAQKTEYHEERLQDLEKKYNRMYGEMMKSCPVSTQKTMMLEKKIDKLEQDFSALLVTLKGEFRFRDKIVITLTSSIVLQFLGLIIYFVFKGGL